MHVLYNWAHWALATDDTLGSSGISCFIVEKGSEGLSFGSKEEKVRT